MTEPQRKRRRWDEPGDAGGSPSPPPAVGVAGLTPVQQLAMSLSATGVPAGAAADAAREAAARAAREAAAKINEQLGKQQPPTPSGVLVGVSKPGALSDSTSAPSGPVQKEFPINHYPPHLRFLLTKGDNHRAIAAETGASVTNKGKYVPPGQQAVGDEKPLYLLVSGPSEEAVEKAIDKLHTIAQSNDGKSQRPEFAPRAPRMVSYRVWVNMQPMDGFDLFGKLRGPDDSYLKHIEKETGAMLSIRGRGSGFKEESGEESAENLHVFCQAPNHQVLDSAKSLASNLIATVRKQYDEHRASKIPKPPPRPAPGPYGAYPPPPYGMYPGAPAYGYPGAYPGYPPAYGAAPGAPAAYGADGAAAAYPSPYGAAPGVPAASAAGGDAAGSASSPQPAAGTAAAAAASGAAAAAYGYGAYNPYAAYGYNYNAYAGYPGYGAAAGAGDASGQQQQQQQQQQGSDGSGGS
eukprot:tig00020710_g13271.t1